MSSGSAVSIVIVNSNTRQYLRECLSAVNEQQDAPEFEVIVVDNASTDGSVEMVRAEFPRVHLIVNDSNLGYAHANNQGIAAGNSRLVLLLNSDAVLSPFALGECARFIELNPRVGVVGVKLLNADGSLQRLSRGRTLSLGSAITQLLLLSNAFPRVRALRGFHVEGDFDHPELIDWVSTACALFRREALTEAGLMDEELVTYGTDLDLCQRIGRASWLVYSLPVEVVHHGGATFADRHRSEMWFRSLRALFAKDYGPAAIAGFDLLVIVGFSLRAVLHLAASVIRHDIDLRERAAADWSTVRAATRVWIFPDREAAQPEKR